MHGSTSPAKKGLPAKSNPRHVPSQSHPRHVTLSRTRPTARRASSLAGSRPSSRSSDRTCIVESHPWLNAVPAHDPSAPCRASSRAPQPSVATFARSAATSSAGAPSRSRITCQRIDGSESSSHCMTDLFGSGACRLLGLVAICWFLLILVKDAVGGLTACASSLYLCRKRLKVEINIRHVVLNSGFAVAHKARTPLILNVIHIKISMHDSIQFDFTDFQKAWNFFKPCEVKRARLNISAQKMRHELLCEDAPIFCVLHNVK